MTKKKPPAHAATLLPSREDLLAYIQDNPGAASKRDLARAFGIKGDRRKALKAMLRDMADEGLVQRGRRRHLTVAGKRRDEVARHLFPFVVGHDHATSGLG